jgi:hypothetical protein
MIFIACTIRIGEIDNIQQLEKSDKRSERIRAAGDFSPFYCSSLPKYAGKRRGFYEYIHLIESGDDTVLKIQPFGTYRIVSIALDGRKHEWNLTIAPNKNSWRLANTEVSVGDNLNGFLIKEVYEISEPPVTSDHPVQRQNSDIPVSNLRNEEMKDNKQLERPHHETNHETATKKIVNSKKWLQDIELIECVERGMRNTIGNDIDPSFINVSGIYQIKNKANGNYYIGRSKNVGFRWRNHINELREGVHHNHLLQEDWCWMNGNLNLFSFELLESCDLDMAELVEREQEYLDDHFGKSNCINRDPYAYDEPWYIEMIKRKKYTMN